MNFLTAGARLTRDAYKMRDALKVLDPTLTDEQAYEQALTSLEQTTREHIRNGLRIKNWFLEEQRATEGHTRYYFITVRPDEKRCSFDQFYDHVKKFTERKCFEDFELVFEQKGTTSDTLGSGFHVHILAHMRQRSKTEVLRDAISSFRKVADDNCVQVDIVKTNVDEERVRNYMHQHTSKDGHKEETKEWDDLWRVALGLLPYYMGGLSSPMAPRKA